MTSMLFDEFDPTEQFPYGRPHPDLAHDLTLFEFMIGTFDCVDQLLLANGTWKKMKGVWQTRYTLNGHAVQDSYRNEIYAGMSIRTFVSAENAWHVAFFGMPGNHSGLWKGGREGDRIVLRSPQTTATGLAVTSRLSFSQISDNGFEWLGERVLEDGTATPNWRISATHRN